MPTIAKKSKLKNEDKTDRNFRDETSYSTLTDIEHILFKSNMYISSIKESIREEYVYDMESNKIKLKPISLCEGIIRLFIEILANCGDNADDSRRLFSPTGDIKVWMDKRKVTIRSGGKPLPVVPKHEESSPEKCFTLVDYVFGKLKTSSHYDETIRRHTAGTNGLGAKLVNIFSKWFSVKVGDSERGQEHESIWENNMQEHSKSKSKPGFYYDENEECKIIVKGKNENEEDKIIIMPGTWKTRTDKPLYKGESYVEVSYELDFDRFDLEEYPDETESIFRRCLIDFGLSCNLKVSFNDVEYDVRDIKDYAALVFTEEECKNSITHYEWDTYNGEMPSVIEKLSKKVLEKNIKECNSPDYILQSKVLLLDTPDNAKNISFVNGLMTQEGGAHVNAAFDFILHGILDKFDFSKKKRGEDDNKKKKEDKKKDDKKLPKLTIREVRPHVSMILVCRLVDPEYSSQSKTQIKGPTPVFHFPLSIFDSMKKWSLQDRLKAELDAKNFKELNAGNSKKRGKKFDLKGQPANFAGSPQSLDCTLCLGEGDSAGTYIQKMRILSKTINPHGKTGQDFIGYIPLSGKTLNALKADLISIGKHKPFISIMRQMGLSYELDYSDDSMLKNLNYGNILICTDADSDGTSITVLLIAWFKKFWPELLRRGMVAYYETYAVKLKDKDENIIHRFPTKEDFDKWCETNNIGNLKVYYYKGLGTSGDSDVIDDIKSAQTVVLIYDEDSEEAVDTSCGKDVKKRKEWMNKWRNITRVKDIVAISAKNILKAKRTINNLINTDLIDFTIDTLYRAIPNFADGLKKSQRQALYYMFEKYNYGKSDTDPIGVSRLANGAAEKLHYHHGEDSLSKTIIYMAQKYIGSNNLNFFSQSNGAFGDRLGNHKGIGKNHAQPRYPKTKPEWWIKHAFSKEMISLVEKNTVEGDLVEPKWLPCIIPLHVVNGVEGMATGWSTTIPCHNPINVIDWLINKCEGKKTEELYPWFNNFKGTIRRVYVRPKGKRVVKKSRIIIDEEEKVEEEEIDGIPVESDDEYEEKDLRAESDDEEGSQNDEEKEEKDEEEKDEEEEIDYRRMSIKTEGIFKITKFNEKKNTADITITEIPVGVGVHMYFKMLEKMKENKKLKDITEHGNDPTYDAIEYRLKELALDIPPESSDKARYTAIKKQLKMVKALKIHNMHLIDMKGFPIKYTNVYDIMNDYYETMINMYTLLIENRIKVEEEELLRLRFMLKLVTLLENDTIVTTKTTKEKIRKQLEEHGIPVDMIKKVSYGDATKEDIAKLEEDIKKQKEKLKGIKEQVPELLWIDDLTKFRKVIIKKMKIDKAPIPELKLNKTEEEEKAKKNREVKDDDDEEKPKKKTKKEPKKETKKDKGKTKKEEKNDNSEDESNNSENENSNNSENEDDNNSDDEKPKKGKQKKDSDDKKGKQKNDDSDDEKTKKEEKPKRGRPKKGEENNKKVKDENENEDEEVKEKPKRGRPKKGEEKTKTNRVVKDDDE